MHSALGVFPPGSSSTRDNEGEEANAASCFSLNVPSVDSVSFQLYQA